MPRKKRIAILVISIILVVFTILGTLGFLFLKTDIFKSNEELFAKYLVQNFNFIEILKTEDTLEIENMLNTNKYKSQLEGKIQYTENIETSDENKNNPINNINVKINSDIDEINNYKYKDISIQNNNEKLVGLEYLKENEQVGIRLNGIKQFVSSENNIEEILQQIDIKNLEELLSKINIKPILNFTNEEKQTLIKTYLEIIQGNITKDKYYKQSNTLITVNNKDVKTNSYYVKLTIEEYNNIYIKILEQITKDEIILSRIDLIEEEIKNKYAEYNTEQNLRTTFIDKINKKIEQVKSNNIGSDEVQIVVYENNKKLVRTSIEKIKEKLTIDIYNNYSIKIDNIKIEDNTNEDFITIEKNNNNSQSNILVEIGKIQNNENIKNIKFNNTQSLENNKINKEIELKIKKGKYEGILNIKDNIEIIQEFENEITLDVDNIKMEEFQEEQKQSIKQILSENMKKQKDKLNSIIGIDDFNKILQNLEVTNKKSVQLPSEGEVTEIEKTRFNSQFEFFVSENLTTDNIKDLIKVTENNFDDMKILLKNGDIENLDLEKLDNYQQQKEYEENISEILILIKRNTNNEEKINDTMKFIEKERDNKYTVTIEYDSNGLAKIIRMKIQEKQ